MDTRGIQAQGRLDESQGLDLDRADITRHGARHEGVQRPSYPTLIGRRTRDVVP
jgi:hypothetical protein